MNYLKQITRDNQEGGKLFIHAVHIPVGELSDE